MYNLFFPATLSGFKPKLKTPKKGVFWSHWLANCVLINHASCFFSFMDGRIDLLLFCFYYLIFNLNLHSFFKTVFYRILNLTFDIIFLNFRNSRLENLIITIDHPIKKPNVSIIKTNIYPIYLHTNFHPSFQIHFLFSAIAVSVNR